MSPPSQTGLAMQDVDLSRRGSWKRQSADQEPQTDVKWMRSADAVLVRLTKFLDAEITDEMPEYQVMSAEQLVELLKDEDQVYVYRIEEIHKLDDFGTFVSMPVANVPADVRIFDHRWVDSAAKSRLTMKDLKCYKSDSIEDKNCPTPSGVANGIFDWFTARFKKAVVCYDVVAAFPHAGESSDSIFMWPPAEWCIENNVEIGSFVWHMLRSLYGRGSAGANFRTLHEAIIVSVPGLELKMLHHEPCTYFCIKTKSMILHHIDDGRIGADTSVILIIVRWMSRFLLLKISDEINVGDAYKYLNPTRLRSEDGWATIPDPKHLKGCKEILGVPESCKPAATPSVKRQVEEADTYTVELSNTQYRSVTGRFIHLSLDVEIIAYAVKELARRLSDPQPTDWCSATRLTRFLNGKEDWATQQRVTKWSNVVEEDVWTDSDWAGLEDCRSTSGCHIELDGFKVQHASVTQPGLPSLSSPESESRALSRGGCLGIVVKLLLEEMGFTVKMRLKCDAQAAIDSTQKLSGSRLRHMQISQQYAKALVRGKHASIDKVSGKANVADCLTKHLSPEDCRDHITRTGFGPFTEKFRLCQLRRINTIEQIEDSDYLVTANEARKRVAEIELGQELAKTHLAEYG